MAFRGHGKLAVSWWGATAPTTGPTGTTAIWAGIKGGFHVPGRVAGFRVYTDASQDGNWFALLWNFNTNELLCAHRFRIRATTGNQWHQTWFRPWVRINTSDFFGWAVALESGRRYQTSNLLNGSPTNHNDIEFNNGFTSTALAVNIAALTLNNNAQGVDLLFVAD